MILHIDSVSRANVQNLVKDNPASAIDQLLAPLNELPPTHLTEQGSVRVLLTRRHTVIAHNPAWASVTNEAELQTVLKETIAPLLNTLSSSLCWDFSIENTPTLRGLKPDGHGRVLEGNVFAKSIPHVAVLVQVKTHLTLASEGPSKHNYILRCLVGSI
jgi:hypothetical protein